MSNANFPCWTWVRTHADEKKIPPKIFFSHVWQQHKFESLSRDVYCVGAGCCCWATRVCACMHRVYCIKCLLELAFFVCLRVWCIFEFMIRDAPLVIITTIIMCCRSLACLLRLWITRAHTSSQCVPVLWVLRLWVYIHWAPPRSPIATACVCVCEYCFYCPCRTSRSTTANIN